MRQQIRFDPSQKLFESYNDFSGGMNTDTSNDRLNNNEFVVLDNVDLLGRGSAKRRTGREHYLKQPLPAGTGQGLFHYFRKGQAEPDIIAAVSGKLYISRPPGFSEANAIGINGTRTNWFIDKGADVYFSFTAPATGVYALEAVGVGGLQIWRGNENLNDKTYTFEEGETYILVVNSYNEEVSGGFTLVIEPTFNVIVPENPPTLKSTWSVIAITGLPDGFQKDLPIEAAQYNSDLFIATGTKLVEYNGTIAKVVEPYKPSSMEAIYIGTNGLADNPDAYIQDGVSAQLSVSGIRPVQRSAVANQPMVFTAFISKPESMTSVEYKWEYRKVGATTWTLGRNFTADANGKSWELLVTETGKYEIKVTVRKTGTTTPTPDFTITNYPVNEVEDKTNQTLPVKGIQKCRKIILHWDRLLLAKDDLNPQQMYISDLNNPRYFPTTNSINFDANKQEPITAMVRYRDMLVIFTRSTIQTLTGKSPLDYRRIMVHDGLGCIADRSAQVIGNHIIFLSNEGIQMLSPTPLTLETLNVKPIDYPIRQSVVRDSNACALVHENQYWLCLPTESVIFRYYYETKVWVRDTSSKLNIADFLDYNNMVYELTTDGNLYKQNNSVYNDVDEVYPMIVESKYYDLSIMFNYKKLKNLYVLARHFASNTNLKVTVYSDSALSLTPEKGQAVVSPDGYVVWESTSEPNMHFYAGTILGAWVLGVNPLGDVQLSVQKARVRGKCRRVKVIFEHQQDGPCEIYAFGLEFKAKKI